MKLCVQLVCVRCSCASVDIRGGPCAGNRGTYFGSPDSEGIVAVACDALAIFALNPASHRSLHAAATFQSTLNLLNALHSIEKARMDTTEPKELVSCTCVSLLRDNANALQLCQNRGMACACSLSHHKACTAEVSLFSTEPLQLVHPAK